MHDGYGSSIAVRGSAAPNAELKACSAPVM
jgi:hypothetical protein